MFEVEHGKLNVGVLSRMQDSECELWQLLAGLERSSFEHLSTALDPWQQKGDLAK